MPEERADPIGDLAPIRRSKASSTAIPIGCCSRPCMSARGLDCRFCFRREMVGPQGLGTLLSEADGQSLCLYRGSSGDLGRSSSPAAIRWCSPRAASPRPCSGWLLSIMSKSSAFTPAFPWSSRSAIDEALIAALKESGKTAYVALHANHPRELTPAARAACVRLVDAGIVMISQSVLLKGVNDDPDTLAALMRAFVETRIKPYYLHHPDLAPGTSHFRLVSKRDAPWLQASAGVSQDCASRPISSTFRAGTGRLSSDLTPSARQVAATRSRTSKAASTPILPRSEGTGVGADRKLR